MLHRPQKVLFATICVSILPFLCVTPRPYSPKCSILNSTTPEKPELLQTCTLLCLSNGIVTLFDFLCYREMNGLYPMPIPLNSRPVL